MNDKAQTPGDDAPDPAVSPGRGTPAVDLMAGTFFLVWAAAGWADYLGNGMLRRSLFASIDPGPALLPLITLWVLTAGGGVILLQGAWRLARGSHGGIPLPPLRSHLVPIAFLASLLAAVMAMRSLGFVTVSFVFCLAWIALLSAPGRIGMRDHAFGLALAAVLAGIITWALHAVFVQLLLIQLPR